MSATAERGPTGPSPFQHFWDAQDDGDSGYSSALAELQAGRKTSHWIWYIFPQLDGLGRSGTARRYAIRDLGEACAYLQDAVLRHRLVTAAAAVAVHLQGGAALDEVMGGHLDALKLVSSLTLFRAAASSLGVAAGMSEVVAACDAVLAIAVRQGVPPCAFTLRQIGSARHE